MSAAWKHLWVKLELFMTSWQSSKSALHETQLILEKKTNSHLQKSTERNLTILQMAGQWSLFLCNFSIILPFHLKYLNLFVSVDDNCLGHVQRGI